MTAGGVDWKVVNLTVAFMRSTADNWHAAHHISSKCDERGSRSISIDSRRRWPLLPGNNGEHEIILLFVYLFMFLFIIY